MTDAAISSQYDDLCNRIAAWVDGELSKLEDSAVEDYTKRLSAHGNEFAKSVLTRTAEAWEYLMEVVIHGHIQDEMFGEDVSLFGLGAETTQLLEEAKKGMAGLKPQRGSTRRPCRYSCSMFLTIDRCTHDRSMAL